MTTGHTSPAAILTRARITLIATAVFVAALDLGVRNWARQALNDGSATDLGLLKLRLAFNPGVAFSLGDALPPVVLLGITGVVLVALAVFAVRVTRTATSLPVMLALAAMLGGAIANLLDRAGDGLVTDYLHTGWFPTSNLADVFVVTSAAVLVVASCRASDTANTRSRA